VLNTSGGSALRIIFSILTAIVLLLAALVFVVPMFISTEEMRNQLFAQVEATTGYRLRVSGPVDLTIFPSIDLVAEDVGVAQPASGSDAEFATAKTLKFGLMLQGLLAGKMRVTEVTLIDPVIAVPQTQEQVQAQQPEPDGAPGADQPPAQTGQGGTASVMETLRNLSLDEVVVSNGTLILPPSGGQPGKRIEKLNLEASLPAYDDPLSFEASAVVEGKPMEAAGSIGNFGQFLDGSPAPVRLTASAPGLLPDLASLNGMAAYKDDVLTLSQFSAKSGDKTLSGSAVYKDDTATLNHFTATMGRDTFAGNAIYKDDVVTINPLRANVRGTVLSGQVSANLANQVPYVVAALATTTLDVNAMTGAPKSKSGESGGGSGGGTGGGNKKKAQAGWSNDPIDFSPLKAVNGKFSLRAEQLIYDQIKINPVAVDATLNGGKLNATLSKFNVYGGGGDAAIALDASGKTPAQRVKLNINKFDAYALLKDAAGFDNLEGLGTIAIDLQGVGASQREIVSTLGGNADLEFTNGAIRGVNIAQMIRSLGSGIVNGWQGSSTEKTDFASLGATFEVSKGQAITNDLHLVGPLVRMTGSGTVNLPQKALDFTVDPQLVASLEGQGGNQDIAGLGVPILIKGPWAKPKFYPDIKGILQNPAQAYQRYKQFTKDVKKIPGAEALSNVIKDGKVDEDALIQGIGGLLGGSQAAPVPEVDTNGAPPTDAAPPADAQPEKTKKSANKKKNKNQTQNQKFDAEDAAKQLLNNWLTGQ